MDSSTKEIILSSKSERILSRAGTVFCQAEVGRKQTDAPDLEATVSDIESRCSRQNSTRSGTQALCAQVAPQRCLILHRGQKPLNQERSHPVTSFSSTMPTDLLSMQVYFICEPYDLYCVDEPGTPAERYNNGFINAGYAIWRELVAAVTQRKVSPTYTQTIEELKQELIALAQEIRVGNPAAKSFMHRYLSDIMNSSILPSTAASNTL